MCLKATAKFDSSKIFVEAVTANINFCEILGEAKITKRQDQNQSNGFLLFRVASNEVTQITIACQIIYTTTVQIQIF